jgi:outer membrane protein insertion porin family
MVLFLAASGPLCAADRPDATVREIVIENRGGGPVDPSFARSHMSLREGMPFTRAQLSRDVKAVLATGHFTSVEAHYERLADGLRLILVVRGKLRLAEPVRVKGAEEFSENKVRSLLDLAPGSVVDDQVLGVRVQKVIAEYRKDFYPDARATWRIAATNEAEGLALVTLTVKEGGRAKVKRVTFSGNRALPARELWPTVEKRGWWNPFRWFGGRAYDPDALDQARFEIAGRYRDEGFLDAAAGEPRIERLPDGHLSVEFPIEEGTKYRVSVSGVKMEHGELTATGLTLFPDQEVRKLIALKPDAVASEARIRETARRIEDHYSQRGYADASVKPVMDADRESGRVNVRFAIVEGSLVRIRRVDIRGNARTQERVIRRELLVSPGDLLDRTKVQRSERIVSNLGFFSSVRSRAVETELPGEKDLIFDVEEKRTGQFMVGAGFSSIDRVMGFAELSQGNFDLAGWPYFTGAGQKLKLRGQFGSRRQSYELSFVEPWFLERKLSLGVDLYRTEVDYQDYDVKTTGAALTLEKPLPGPNRVSLRYSLDRASISDIADTNEYVRFDHPAEPYFFTREEKDTVESSLLLTLKHDTRNHPFTPTRGHSVRVFGGISGGVLGFDTDVYQAGWRTSHYVPLWFGHVLNLRTRYEVVEEYGDTDEVPITDRLFLGGGRTLRGFDYRDVGPKVIRKDSTPGHERYRPVGGRSLALANAEYLVPIVSHVRLAAFYDTGNVWRDAFDVEFGGLASTAGVGIRLDVPGFPIRVDRGWVIQRDDRLTDKDAWAIWIGYDY